MNLVRSKRIQNACTACTELKPDMKDFTLSMLSTMHRSDESLEDSLERVWNSIFANMMGGEI